MGPTIELKPPEGIGDIAKVGEILQRPMLRNHILGTVLMWMNKWGKEQVSELIVKHFVDHDVYDASCKLSEASKSQRLQKHRNTEVRTKGEASAWDLVSSLAKLDRECRLPEIVVPVIDSRD